MNGDFANGYPEINFFLEMQVSPDYKSLIERAKQPIQAEKSRSAVGYHPQGCLGTVLVFIDELKREGVIVSGETVRELPNAVNAARAVRFPFLHHAGDASETDDFPRLC